MSPSRWLTWTLAIDKTDEPKPTRTTTLDFVSFVRPQADHFSVIDRPAIAKSYEPVLTKLPNPNPIIEESPEMALTNPTKPDSVSFGSGLPQRKSMQNRWLKWQPESATEATNQRKDELIKPETTDKTALVGGSVSFGSGPPQRKSITRISVPVREEMSEWERREATEKYLSQKHEPIECLKTLPAKTDKTFASEDRSGFMDCSVEAPVDRLSHQPKTPGATYQGNSAAAGKRTVILHHDFETRSEVDLQEVGLENYGSSPTTRVLLLSWAIDDGPVQLWGPHLHGPEVPEEVRELLLDPTVVKVAWNTPFERAIWRHIFKINSPADQWQDPMVQARYLSLPGKLELAGPIGGLPMEQSKIKEGRSLLNLFSMANKKGKHKGEFNDWNTHPEEWAKFCRYCVQDTEAERAFYRRFMR
jgi:hypothetical protein